MATADILLLCPAARHGRIIGAAPSDVANHNDAEPVAAVGGLYAGAHGKLYMYVRVDLGVGSVATVAGQAAYIDTIASWAPHSGVAVVTSDVSDASPASAGAVIVGAFLYAGVTDDYYTFIQCGGVIANALTDANAAGDRLIASTTDGEFDDASGAAKVVEHAAIAMEAAS